MVRTSGIACAVFLCVLTNVLGAPLTRLDSAVPELPDRDPPPPPPKPKLPPRNDGPYGPAEKVEYKDALKKAVEDVAQQQDVFEVISKILYKIMYAIKPDSEDTKGYQIDRIRNLFFGNRVWRFQPKVTDDAEDTWYSLELPLHSAPKDVYELLDAEMDIAEVTFNGRPAPRYSTFTKLPPIMQMCLGRQGFEGGQAFMLKHHVELNEVIYMDRYMDDGAPDILERRQKSWTLKARLKSLQATREALSSTELGLDASDAMEAAYQWIENVGDEMLDEEVDTSEPDAPNNDGAAAAAAAAALDKATLLAALRTKSEAFSTHLAALDREIATTRSTLSTLFADLTSHPYQLAAVFVHRGQDRAGHYWVYIRDFAAGPRAWRRYEDHRVTLVSDPAEIFRRGDPQLDGAPYMLAYVRDGEKDGLVQPLFRAPRVEDGEVEEEEEEEEEGEEEEEPTSPLDTEMPDLIGGEGGEGERVGGDAVFIEPVHRVESFGEVSQTPILQRFDENGDNVMGEESGDDEEADADGETESDASATPERDETRTPRVDGGVAKATDAARSGL